MNATPAARRTLTQSLYEMDLGDPLVEEPIGTVLLRAAERHRQAIALVDGDPDPAARRDWTFEALAADAQRVAHALLRRFSPGDRVAIWSSNSPEWVLIEFGAALAGLVLVTVNPAYLGRELAHVLSQSQARGIFVQDLYRGRNLLAVLDEVRGTLPALETVIPMSGWDEFLDATGEGQPLPTVAADDLAQIQYTSGTTGAPKGACLTHRGLANNGRLYARAIGAVPGDVWINPMPMFHTAGCGLATLGALQTGGVHVIPPGFRAAEILDLFERERGTVMLCVPTMLVRILEERRSRERAPASWRLVTLGGAPVSPDLVREAQDELGVEVGIGFGQTEASPYLTHTVAGDDHPGWMETVGRPLPHTDVKIVDPASGDLLPVGTPGEICGRGYGIMPGYFRDEATSRLVLDADGWLHTGDIGSMDAQGYVRVHGRLRDMIIRGGENIYPREIEEVLSAHPGVAAVAALGLPDPVWGETVVAFVQAKAGASPSADELDSFCGERLASYKRPGQYHFVDAFPETASGKVQKFVLRDRLLRSTTA